MKTTQLSLLFTIFILLQGCVSNYPAIDTLDSLEESYAQATEVHKKLEKSLVKQIIQEHRKTALARIDASQAQTIQKIHEKSEAKIDSLVASALGQLESAIEPTIDGIRQQLESAKVSGDRLRELELAVELSASLAVYGEERTKLREKVIKQVNDQRQKHIELTKSKFSELKNQELLSFSDDTDTQADKILSSFFTEVDNNQQSTADALKQIRRHIDINRLALKAFSDNVIPDGGVKTIAELAGFGDLNQLLFEKLDSARVKLESKANDIGNNALTLATQAINNIN